MMLSKEECLEAFDHILFCDRDKPHSYISDAYRNDFNTLHRLIKEHFDNNNARTIQNLVSEIDKLEKALDKACEFIGCNFDCPYATLNQCTLDDRCSDDYKECWKEWLLDEVKG